jgi:ribonuclease J
MAKEQKGDHIVNEYGEKIRRKLRPAPDIKKGKDEAADGKRKQGGRKKAAAEVPAQVSAASPKRVAAKPKKAKNTAADEIKSALRTNHKPSKSAPLRVIPLGGLSEIGKNLTVFQTGNDMIIVDCGLAFPDSDMPGVDIVIPDFTFLEQNREKLRGVVITHGHEDHIGALVYLLKKINLPVYATKLTLGLIETKLSEHGLERSVELITVAPRQIIKLGQMAVEFIRVNHSIPDAVALAIYTPAGIVIHTGDFKVDFTPIESEVIDIARFAELGARGVLLLMSDSTNAERPGHTASERTVGRSFEKLFERAEGKRIIVATFSTNIHRIQQIADSAHKTGRKVAVFGRSMLNVIDVATKLGYLNIPEGLIIDIESLNRFPADKTVIITTGSQGEPMSALTRMSQNEHRTISITPQDVIIISATPIPGNEKLVNRVVNELMKLGAEVIYQSMYDVHVSGHACEEDLKLMISLTKPRFFIPVHGEFKHLRRHAKLAFEMGMEQQNVLVAQTGNVIEISGSTIKIVDQAVSGRVFVDGLGVGDVGSIVLRDRRHLAQDGLIIAAVTIETETMTVVSGPDIVSRGFVYVRESEELMREAREILEKTINKCLSRNICEWNFIKGQVKEALSDYIFFRTKRKPMILPIIMEI